MKQNPYVPTLRLSTVTQQLKTRLTSQRQRRTVKKCLKLLKCWGNGERTWQTKSKEGNKKKMRGNRISSVVLRQNNRDIPSLLDYLLFITRMYTFGCVELLNLHTYLTNLRKDFSKTVTFITDNYQQKGRNFNADIETFTVFWQPHQHFNNKAVHFSLQFSSMIAFVNTCSCLCKWRRVHW